MEQQQPTPAEPMWPANATTPMPVASQAPQGQYGPYYPPTLPAQAAFGPWQGGQPYVAAAAPRPARMPKDQALAVTRKLKAVLIAGSVMAFGVFTALAAGHVIGVTSQQSGTSGASGSNASAGSSSQTLPSNTSGANDQGGFFNQAPSSNSGSTGGFGTSPNAPYQQPAIGSNMS